MSKFLILIPARFGSSRFPGKPLHKINGKSMISYVVENCILSGFDYAVVTDNDDIENEVLNLKGNVVRVDDNVTTGSERIALAYKKFFKDKNYEYKNNELHNKDVDLKKIDKQFLNSVQSIKIR